MLQFACPTIDDTKALAAAIGRVLKGGEVIAFISDLGGGKTTFVKGLAEGMDIKDVIQSPTFVISQLHRARRGLELHHYDFYRLTDGGIMRAELAESLMLPNVVVAIEWGDVVADILPPDTIEISIRVPEAETRVISIDLPAKYGHILKALNEFKEGQKSA